MMDTLFPLLLFSVFGIAAVLICSSRVPREEQRWLTTWLLVALMLRLGAATLFAAFPESRIFHEDANGYELLGIRLAMSWRGQAPPINLVERFSQNYGFFYVGGALYYVFGLFRPLMAYFNCVVGTVTVFLIYRLARQLYHPLVARRAALLAALVPSMVLWSSIAIKDALMGLLVVLGLSSCVAIKRRFSIGALLGIVVSLVAVQPIRFYMVYFVGFAILMSLLLERGVRMVSGVYKQILIGAVFIGLFTMIGFAGRAEQGLDSMSLARVSDFRHGMAISANSGFDANVDVSTPGAALAFLPIGISELLLGPFPWQFGSVRALMAAPETIYWWFLFPAVLRGMWWMFRKRFAETSPLLIFAVTMTAAYSLMHGNVGSGFRQRAQIFIILFIFAALGSYRRRCERAGLDADLLLNDTQPAAPPPAPEPVAVRA